MEIDEEPECLFKYHQLELSTCSEPGKYASHSFLPAFLEKSIHENIVKEVKKYKSTKDENPVYLRSLKDSTLLFNSKFESGNLREVEKVNDLEYNLYLNFDFNTLNYTQWYYFSVRNFKKGNGFILIGEYRLHI